MTAHDDGKMLDPNSTLSRSRWPLLASLLWGVVLSFLVCRTFFLLRHGQFFENHDSDGYGLRLIEFRDALWNGVLFPQWCVHFRGGLGAPFFNYYQPGFFYVASLAPSSLPVAQQIGCAVFFFSIVGYCGMLSLLHQRFSVAVGTLAGTFLLTAPYIHTELYIRGDFSEYAAMMLVPAVLAAILQFCEEPSRWVAIASAVFAAMVVMTHPAIGMVLFGMLAFLFLVATSSQTTWSWARRGFTLLAIATGLSAAYWLPVFLESRYSSVEKMWDGKIFDGYYQYSRHFLNLSWMFDRSVTQTPIPVKLGLWHTLIAGIGLVGVTISWKQWSATQRRVAALCAFLLGANLFLMTPQSAWLWKTLPLLRRIQFPWRLLSFVSLAMAGLAGMSLQGIKPDTRRYLGFTLLAGFLLWPTLTRSPPKVTRINEPRSAAEIADQFFAPDLADEWLPRDAKSLRIDPQTRRVISNPPVEVSNYRIQQTGLECRLKAREKSSVILPHYYFPVGFSASLNGESIPLMRNSSGLMKVEVPAGYSGNLRVEWHTTQSKQLGAMISFMAAAIGIGVLIFRDRSLHDQADLLNRGVARFPEGTRHRLSGSFLVDRT